jgi:mRNA-degrading endonuclease RelE of RelBE toxin-antitoxin system
LKTRKNLLEYCKITKMTKFPLHDTQKKRAENPHQTLKKASKNNNKNVLRIRKKTFYLQFCMETEGHQKGYIEVAVSVII